MELPDPVTGEPFTVNRDNVLALLAVDVDNLVLESQTVAMMFGEMARVHAAAKLAKEQADVDFRRWKAAKAAEARATLDNGMTAGKNPTKKPPTKEQVEGYYRSAADYDAEYRKTNRAAVIVDLIADLKEAFKLKQRALHDLHGITFGHNEVATTDDRMREMEARLEATAIPMMQQSSLELDEIRRNQGQPTPAAPTDTKPKSGKTPRRPKPAKGASK
jgi:hypothetical protein